jgi:hypothetical protein
MMLAKSAKIAAGAAWATAPDNIASVLTRLGVGDKYCTTTQRFSRKGDASLKS